MNQLGEELRDKSGRGFTGKVLADAADDQVDILSILEFNLNTTGIQNQCAGNAVAYRRKY